MRTTTAALLLSTASSFADLTTAHAHRLPEISIQKRDRHTNGRTRDVANGLVKRQGTLETTVFDILTYTTGGAYYANITVGTPPQPQTVIVDTGSSDLYFDASTSQACQSTGKNSCRGGSFDPSKSSTYKVAVPAPAFNTSFGDGSTANGPYGTDTVQIDNVALSNIQFGVATTVKSTVGYAVNLMGVGYSGNEATRNEYPNIPESLVSAKVINSRLYSVYLNDGESSSGSILFGGIDTDKYTGTLQTVDILPDLLTKQVDRFITSITDLTVTVNGKKTTIFSGGLPGIDGYRGNNPAQPVLLDTGSAAWSVSPQLFDFIVKEFPYVQNQQGQGLTPCSNRYNSDMLTVTFNGAIDINVPVADFIIPAYNPSTNLPYQSSDGQDVCVFMIVPSAPTGLGFQPAGDAILRSMYIVYDLDNGQMGLAQANVNSTSSSVKTVAAGPSGIANAAKNVKTVMANNYSIAATAQATVNVVASTVKTTVGDTTGTAAVPQNGQPGNSAAASVAANTPSTSTSSAASALTLPIVNWQGAYVTGFALIMAALGAGLML